MSTTHLFLLTYIGTCGLITAIVGLAVLLLMPERSGRRVGARIAIAGAMTAASEILMVHSI